MSNMKKIFLLILSLSIILTIFLWNKYFIFYFFRIGNDFNYRADLYSQDNFYYLTRNEFKGEVPSMSKFEYVFKEEKDNTIILENSLDVRTIYGENIFSISRNYGIDKLTLEHDPSYNGKNRNGYLFGPRNLRAGDDFTYWHVNYDNPALMKFVKEETINGLKVFQYETNYENQVVDQTDSLSYLPGVPEKYGIRLQPHLVLWVEPLTGWLVKYSDQTNAYYYDIENGDIIAPWNSFRNYYTDNSISKNVLIASNLKSQFLILKYGINSFLVLILLLFLVPLFTKTTNKYKLTSIKLISIFSTLIFFIFLILFLVGWYTRIQSLQTYEINIDEQKNSIKNEILNRMNVYADTLRSTGALFYTTDDVSRDQWSEYFNIMSLQQRYPGIQGVGYAQVIKKDEIQSLEEKVRSQGYPFFNLYPLADRDEYSAIIYLEPFDQRNQQAFGYDMFSEEKRKRAMLKASQTNDISLSGKVKLVQEIDQDVQPGSLMYFPIIKAGETQGYVYSIFRMHDLFNKIFVDGHNDVDIRIYDAQSSDLLTQENLFYDSNVNHSKEKIIGKTDIYLYNSKWIVEYYVVPSSQLYSVDYSNTILFLIFSFITILIVTIFFIIIYFSQKKSNRGLLKVINESKSQINEIINKQSKLSTYNKRLEKLEKINNIGYFEYDLLSKINYWSSQLYQIHQLQDNHEPVDFNNYIDFVVPVYKKYYLDKLNGLYKATSLFEFKVQILNKKNKLTWIKIKSFTENDNNKLIKIYGTMEDITQEELLNISQRKLITHLINQIIKPVSFAKNSIKNAFLHANNSFTKDQTKNLINAEKHLNYIEEIDEIVKDLIGLQNNSFKVSQKLFHPKDLLRLVLSNYDYQFKEKNIKLTVVVDSEIQPILSDISHLKNIVSVIISNAIKFSHQYSTISINVRSLSDGVRFEFEDHGLGIPADEITNVFKKYFKASNTPKNSLGSGLSLYYADQVVKRLGGSISIKSIENKGTTITLIIPRKAI